MHRILIAIIIGLFSLPLLADDTCRTCHIDQYGGWQISHHAQAMATATEESVLGDFSGVTIDHHSQTAIFLKTEDGFQVAIKDKDGKAVTYSISYTFGVTPLQQYLVKTDKGKYQVLPFAWDSRDESKGGQRWFHIYPDEYLPAGDRLHWQQPLQNWNGMCADCHSTGLKRNYNEKRDVFKTSFSKVNISCSSCHVDASAHASAQNTMGKNPPGWKDDLMSYLNDMGGFTLKEGAHTATWSGKGQRRRPEMEVCSACHSLRSPLRDGIDPSKKFMDQFSPTLLDDPLYFADGQIKEEVYVWGSFLQSKMYQKGVSCFDCHDSHSLKLKAEGNGVCTQCHSAPVFDTPKHHKHKTNTKGAMCVNCHMPERSFMVVDPRRDHSFKIPRPDISIQTGSPNACTTCHTDQSNSWAAKQLNHWFPGSKHRNKNAVTVHKARRGNPSARRQLHTLINDDNIAAITRATALSLIPRVADRNLINLAIGKLNDPSALLRIGAIRALAVLPPENQHTLISPLLDDEFKAVRVEAARTLLSVPSADLTKAAFTELLQADRISSWRGEGRMNLSQHAVRRGDMDEAERQYRQSLKQDPSFAPALVNLAELLRQTGRENEAVGMLAKASTVKNVDGAILHSYGLALIRSGDRAQALIQLERATKADRNNARYVYVYLVALNSMGQPDKAYRGVKAALRRHRFDPVLLQLARSFAAERGDTVYQRQIETRISKL
ncbi:tetratricopeptide repeat protein [Temperatibacter marinus]|uniref:Tetratricopeptide repeat protein n=1 Tax=Temperatibacter marinus TaxID=1456591 RepID=A0AA52EKD6_9PROT|nr:tetratricopeptide repeat protein [Temperatibacter marinus]WND03839.1 tetratricopeptide repeat protein [Temperatibacter marinus]